MTRFLITRRNPRTGRIERPWRNRDGVFVLGDPEHGAQKHHDRFAVKVATLAEVAALVRRGFSLRMTDGESPPSLISPSSLEIEEEEGDEDSELWAETLPRAPFSKDDMLTELCSALLVQANQIAHAGGREAAVAFIGFETESPYPYCEDDSAKVDLSRFNATGYLDLAYDYAFQVGRYWAFGDDDAQDLNEFVQGANPRSTDGKLSPLADPDSLCRRTADMAFARWKLSGGRAISLRELALLADMKEPAVRNSLSKERIALENGTVDGTLAERWLAGRRDFIPTRTREEGRKESWVTYARTTLQREAFPDAFRRLLKEAGISEAELAFKAQVSETFIGLLAAGRPSLDLAALRRVSDVLDLDTPHFVGAVVEVALRAETAA